MKDYDVIIIGGGINGLTCAAYLAKAGLKVILLENRGECGTHCDTTEPGIPGFLHNLHATWLISAMSPSMTELELEKFGLEYVVTDYIYGKTFENRKNVLQGVNFFDTQNSWEKHSKKDADIISHSAMFILNRLPDIMNAMHEFFYKAPSNNNIENVLGHLFDDLLQHIGMDVTFKDVWEMNGFQTTDLMFESEYIKTMIQSLSWIGGFPPIHKTIGSLGCGVLGPLAGPIFPVHQAKGGSHSLTHALIKAATSYGVKILSCCPVKKIIVKNGEVQGVQLSEHAIYANEVITAKKVVSNVTLIPTFIDLIGEEHLSPKMISTINTFDYNEQNLFGVYYALDDAPQFASAEFDEGIQKCFMGYFGGNNSQEMKNFNNDLINGIIHDNIIGNWFIPTLADPSQAPDGCHTSFVWIDVPPNPKSWKYGKLNGLKDWDTMKYQFADMITDTYEKYAPGFKKLIKDRIIYTPLDMQRNNPSAVLGNWVGGSVIPSQFLTNRPVPGILKNGGSRTFMKNLYLSNSIHPFGATWLASGYIAATEVAEDLNVRDQSWWNDKACTWYLENISRIPKNLGVK